MEQSKINTILLSVLVALVAAGGGYYVWKNQTGPKGPVSVSIAELVTHPEKYNGKEVKTSGVRVSAFEASALAEGTVEANGEVQLKEPLIWLESPTITNQHECFFGRKLPRATFCSVDAQGIFETGGSYGHLGQYRFQIRGTGGTAPPQVTTGFIEGKVTISPLCVTARIARCLLPADAEALYEVVVYLPGRRLAAARTNLSAAGEYRLELPVGNYVIDVVRVGPAAAGVTSREITVSENQTATADFSVQFTVR